MAAPLVMNVTLGYYINMLSNKSITELILEYKINHDTYIKGEVDCCIFVADIVKQLTGIDYAENLRNKYSTIPEHIKLIEKIGCKSISDLPNILLKTKKKLGKEAKYSDVVYWEPNTESEGMLGICNGARAYFFSLSGKLIAIPIEECLYSWELPSSGS